ncbi:DUF2357 domain-containing protein [Pasteurella multocida]|uniref:DUF2357 domain-containing protein n=1 Tax=Pasteurella multocida TaxID=747 RepID=UPI002020AC27|nr:DUF2357 domain-containing protein [Pasteurella multocida]MCL7816494.1 restriction endonuclease-like protein [Pasteurella multocida]MDY0640805.1 restriction endonuclease-like protein [Pasteurella multocida]HDR1025325.1 DUF2357 domain-containing protein [Pasteurella multocida]HDR1103044.1 DUF2357 domain-containing protein [Pasteurella multocida]HDR1154582.1 DUF2357 domain-containing protein [Pasteurella multocida]
MKEWLSFDCDDFTLTIWCSGVESRKSVFEARVKSLSKSVIHFSENMKNVKIKCPFIDNPLLPESSTIELPSSIFFENLQYQFEWVFNSNVEQAEVIHSHRSVNEAFRFKHRHLIGNINTGNDIGWFTLPIRYSTGNKQKEFEIKFEILPTKIDLHSDIPTIYQTIDSEFPLLRFNFLGKTEQYSSESQKRGNFPLFWLAHFKQLREKLIHNIKVIMLAPHQRLQQKSAFVKADRLVGKQSSRQLEKIRHDIKNGLMDKRYQVNPKFLSANTPENRFIKWISVQTQRQINNIIEQLQTQQNEFSEALTTNLKNWIAPLIKLEKQSFLKDINPEYLDKSTLVLQQKTGYSQVYYLWQELRLYLDFFEQSKTISMKSVAELYEIWCFITLKNMLLELGFQTTQKQKNRLRQNKFAEYQLKDGLCGAFYFEKGNIQVRLAHEPIFRKEGKEIRTFWVTQKPDILLEVTFPNKQKYIWLFDAKYRIASGDDLNQEDLDKTEKENDTIANREDLVPEDALNQMHRYRDALIHISQHSLIERSRPVFGAFALYPGHFQQNLVPNPYQSVIDAIGIGAFALLPSQDKLGQTWLMTFLKEKLDFNVEKQQAKTDGLYIENPARISALGMNQAYYRNLVMTIRIGDEREDGYIQKFREGTASYYHTKTDIFDDEFNHKIVSELCFLAIAYPTLEGEWGIDKIYPILNVEIKERKTLSREQTGSNQGQFSEALYYCFELSQPIVLKNKIEDIPVDRFRESIKLPTLEMLQGVNTFNKLQSVYENVLVQTLK